MNILIVDPEFRTKFPPIGLMKISSYHKSIGDSVSFVRGKDKISRCAFWDKIYVSSLFTWTLDKTQDAIDYYSGSTWCSDSIYSGGIGATLHPDYLNGCTVIEGRYATVCDSHLDYSLLDNFEYKPTDSYFVKTTEGCVRRCSFCAVPKLESSFKVLRPIKDQVHGIHKRHMCIMDNNILASPVLDETLKDLVDVGLTRGSKRNVDFNQGLDARLLTDDIADSLSRINVSPVRFACDHLSDIETTGEAIRKMSKRGFRNFMVYLLYNYKDDSQSLYERMRYFVDLSDCLCIKVTGFPMRYIPITETNRGYVSPTWTKRELRGVQCILNATRGIVSPNKKYFIYAFGNNVEEFKSIISKSDADIMYRSV